MIRNALGKAVVEFDVYGKSATIENIFLRWHIYFGVRPDGLSAVK